MSACFGKSQWWTLRVGYNRTHLIWVDAHRYLRATKWVSSDAAIKRIEETLRWRREFGFYDKLNKEYVEPEVRHDNL